MMKKLLILFGLFAVIGFADTRKTRSECMTLLANGQAAGAISEADVRDCFEHGYLTVRSHATDCTSITDGVQGDLCFELDDNTLYSCETATCSAAGWAAAVDATKQPVDADLTAIAALACAEGEIVKRNGSNTWICSTDSTGAGSLPDQTGNVNKLLSTDGADADWRDLGAGLVNDATSVRVDDSAVVMATGTQTVAGDKTFTGDTAVTGDVDFSGSTATQACQSGATPPGTCVANSECFIDTDDEQFLICDSAGTGWDQYGSASAGSQVVSIQIVIDGGGAEIATGVHGDIEVPFACTITQVTGLADQSGSIVVDIWKDTYANYPPTNTVSITASAPLTLSTAVKAQDSTLTGWTTSISAGDILRYNVDSVTTIERLTVSLKCTR